MIKKDRLIFIGIWVLLMVLTFVLVIIGKIDYEQYAAAGGILLSLVGNLYQLYDGRAKDERIEVLEQRDK
jgi:putative effector of murein hydrolase